MEIKLYDIKQLAEVLHVTTRTIQQMITDGRLQAVKIGRKWMVTEEALKEFLKLK